MRNYDNIELEYNVLFGPHKGERGHEWFMAGDPEINRILSDKRLEAKVTAVL